MNQLCKMGLPAIALFMAAACNEYEPLAFHAVKPESVVLQEDIDSYDALKSYIDRSVHNQFKLGGATSLSSYIQKGVMYRLINRNFDEITLGYAMKHGAVVQADGSLILSDVAGFLAMANEAGLSVYGHTLCWHVNQNAAYLNKLIEPTVIPRTAEPTLGGHEIRNSDFESGIDGWSGWGNNSTMNQSQQGEGADGSGYALMFTNPSQVNAWEAQVAYDFAVELQTGAKYVLNFKVKANKTGTISANLQDPSNYAGRGDFGSVDLTTSWQEVTLETVVSGENAKRFLFNYGNFDGTVWIDDISLRIYNESGSGGDAGYAYTFTNQSAVNFWEAQVAYDLPNLENNQEYVLKFAVKATEAGAIRAEIQSTSDYSSNSFGTFAVSPAWHEYEFTTTTTKGDRNRLVISFGDYVGTVYIDNVSLAVKKSASNLIANGDFESGTDQGWAGWGNGSTRGVSAYGEGFGGVGDQIIEKTPEEKKEILTTALETWIAGMMEVAKDHVHAWDVVNEPMSDWPDPYQLKTGLGKTDMASDEFYWQDYLGTDYAVVAFRLAEQYGKPGDLLFINDYGLESNLDKCKGLIEYAKYIESQGARVDGIGTQMHISTSDDRERIAEMFELLAATGKLIKISELDIGVGVPTAQATEQDYQAQAEMYRYVVEKYFELIPPAQRYGITVWSPLDSPQGSSWRAGEPIGLWTEGYVRKPAYAAFAEALTGQ